MKHKLRRIAAALYFSLGLGVMGALAGWGCSLVYPAQYTSSARVAVPTAQFAGDYSAASAYVARLVEAARDPQALAVVIVSRELYGTGGKHQPLSPLIDRLRHDLRIHSHTNLQNAVIDLSLTYPDSRKVRTALAKVIWFIQGAQRQGSRLAGARWNQRPVDVRTVGEPVRTKGLDPGKMVTLGFFAGLLASAVLAKIGAAAAKEALP